MGTIDLSAFCTRNDFDGIYRAPFLDVEGGEFAYATNDHILVRVKNADGYGISEVNPQNMDVEGILAVDPDTLQDPVTPDRVEPGRCYCGSGTTGESGKEECPDCDGAGEFMHGDHYYDCKTCDGGGEVEGGTQKKICRACRGTGILYPDVVIGDTRFGGNYIDLIARLPGATFRASNVEGKAATFAFDGGCGVLMPMRG